MAQTAKDIGHSNASCGADSYGFPRSDYSTRAEAFLAYLQNTIDTAKDRGVSVEEAVAEFAAQWAKLARR